MPLDLTPAAKGALVNIDGCDWLPDVSNTGPASGAHSGTVSSASEAWCQTTQTYNSEYVRIIRYTQPATLDVIGLTQLSAVDNVNTTALCNVITIYNKQEKVYLPVGTPGYTQYQKLALNAISTDQYAQSYGVVSGLIMGPQGSIVTTQPYFNQEKWDTTKHTEYDYQQIGTTHGLMDTSAGPKWLNGTNNGDPLTWYIYQRDFWRSFETGGWVNTNDAMWKVHVYGATWGCGYGMNGGYSTSAEDAWNDLPNGKQRMINYIADTVAGFTNTNTYRLVIPQPTKSNGSWWIQSGDRVTTNTYYDIKRHDYS